MSEVEKQESQKTVVAFITGLLIGGLLVWVFSSSPESKVVVVADDQTENKSEQVSDTTQGSDKETSATKTKEVIGKGSITITNQDAGNFVALDSVEFPSNSGWIVVRDYMDGVPGNVLGAARYDVDGGLTPNSVELIRNTTSGSSYQVVFYTNEGDMTFKLDEDMPIDTTAATFKAN
ncbi:MAG: hypothetical protein K9M10_01080 [Candidatus Pacebacteria bacterium]|nr:hypothetical protein [Candidatus Paceibacterota bacterium]MCF7857056.1 hypothetical protein [Candidatus Paceibacterota bacterium]